MGFKMGFDDILLDFMPYKMDYNGVKFLACWWFQHFQAYV